MVERRFFGSIRLRHPKILIEKLEWRPDVGHLGMMYGLDVMSVSTSLTWGLYEASPRSETWTIFHNRFNTMNGFQIKFGKQILNVLNNLLCVQMNWSLRYLSMTRMVKILDLNCSSPRNIIRLMLPIISAPKFWFQLWCATFLVQKKEEFLCW